MLEVDKQGRIRLSMKAVAEEVPAARAEREELSKARSGPLVLRWRGRFLVYFAAQHWRVLRFRHLRR